MLCLVQLWRFSLKPGIMKSPSAVTLGRLSTSWYSSSSFLLDGGPSFTTFPLRNAVRFLRNASCLGRNRWWQSNQDGLPPCFKCVVFNFSIQTGQLKTWVLHPDNIPRAGKLFTVHINAALITKFCLIEMSELWTPFHRLFNSSIKVASTHLFCPSDLLAQV